MDDLAGFDARMAQLGYPRLELLRQDTPIRYLSTLSKELDCELYIKRDDMGELGLGGNKLRKLEYLLAQARSSGATRVITVGAMQSNHARLTACVSRMYGFDVDLVLKDSVPLDNTAYVENGNLLLNSILGASIHRIPRDGDAKLYVEDLMKLYDKKGEKVYFIPVGGSNAIGSLGYVRAAFEIQKQSKLLGLSFRQIGFASGSGGTHAGLLAGFGLLNQSIQINAYNVQPQGEPLQEHTRTLLDELRALIRPSSDVEFSDLKLTPGYSGEAYGIPTESCLKAIELLAQTEGIFLDPVYTAKAFAGLLTDLKQGRVDKKDSVLFIHTGGIPGLFAYPSYF